MRIAFLTWRDTGHPDGGGSEVYVEQIAQRLAARGHQVTVVTARYPGARADESRRGVRYRRRGGRLSVYPRGLAWLLGRDGRRQDAVVEVINGLPFAARLVRRDGLIALVHHLHREQWRMIYPGLGGRLGWTVESRVTPRLYRRVPHVTVSDASRTDLIGLGIAAESVTVIHNGSTLAGVLPTPAGVTTATPRLCVLGRLVPHKQVEHALHVVAELRRQGTEVPLDVIGSGWWADRLVAEARRLGVSHLVQFHGQVGDAERDALLAGAWVHLMPSVKEGWGRVVVDAALQATPSVAYRAAGGVRESIEDGVTGLLVDDLDALTRATADLLADRERCLEMGRAARARAALFDWETSTDQVEELLSPDPRR
ncbi:glycosyltransferase family 4 protein [Nocardioides dubius]|uniref:Glycosyltransferase family 4 protein n=1 Tax=Nocardioides dubius TaxID=317019 RepID=A0ABP4EA90_9ACTN